MRKAGKTLRTHFSLGGVACYPSVDFSWSWLASVLQPVLRQSRRQKEDTWNLFLLVLVAMFCLLMLSGNDPDVSPTPPTAAFSAESQAAWELQKYLTGNCSSPYACLCLGSSDTKDKTSIKPSFWPGKCQQDPVQWRAGPRLVLENASDLRGDVFSAPNQLYLFAVLQIFKNLVYFYIEELCVKITHGLNFLIRTTCHLQFPLHSLKDHRNYFKLIWCSWFSSCLSNTAQRLRGKVCNASIQRCFFIVGFLLCFPVAAMYFCS